MPPGHPKCRRSWIEGTFRRITDEESESVLSIVRYCSVDFEEMKVLFRGVIGHTRPARGDSGSSAAGRDRHEELRRTDVESCGRMPDPLASSEWYVEYRKDGVTPSMECLLEAKLSKVSLPCPLWTKQHDCTGRLQSESDSAASGLASSILFLSSSSFSTSSSNRSALHCSLSKSSGQSWARYVL